MKKLIHSLCILILLTVTVACGGGGADDNEIPSGFEIDKGYPNVRGLYTFTTGTMKMSCSNGQVANTSGAPCSIVSGL